MRKRFLVSIVGGIVGLAVSVPLTDTLGVSQTLALVVCSIAGILVGYVASTLWEVFAGSPHDSDAPAG
jgi:putative flippase GtrA